ncbi:carboxysome shell carbonic anhydrase [Nitrincola sp. A-D6]|uniref:carboxysome shell carbonic anhydrase n=1 Tax=Nitrincola sp. A-D6 TaxID=1545442 RepID=UPI000A8B2A55|nr:carboxysome shell carbonic anhydrase [Nitrincola sp. A-D6]
MHSSEGESLDLSTLKPDDLDSLPVKLEGFFTDMPAQIRHDLLPLVEGNLRHIDEMRQLQRDLDIEHREWMICVGRGFDFLHVPNVALIIGLTARICPTLSSKLPVLSVLIWRKAGYPMMVSCCCPRRPMMKSVRIRRVLN